MTLFAKECSSYVLCNHGTMIYEENIEKNNFQAAEVTCRIFACN
jgi:hypothetical protein